MAETPRSDLQDKLNLEALLLRSMRGTFKRAAREVRISLEGGSPHPDVAMLIQPTVEANLKAHFRRCERVFGTNLQDQFPDDIKPSDIEATFIETEILRILDSRAERQSIRISQTTSTMAQKAWNKAVLLRTMNPDDDSITERDLPRIAANAFLTRTSVQARMIATTETQMGTETVKGVEASMLIGDSTVEVKRRAPVIVAKKIWRSQGDSRVRTSEDGPFDHLEADGQVASSDGAFIVGGERLKWPGDISFGASPGNIINCRCSAIYDEPSFEILRRQHIGNIFEETPDQEFRLTESTNVVAAETGITTTDTNVRVEVVSRTLAQDSQEMFTLEDGTLLPGRQALHDDIVSGLTDGVAEQEKPVFHMMGGGSGAGKGSVGKRGLASFPEDSVFVDSDNIKKQLPEFDLMIAEGDTTAAAFVHSESSGLAKTTMRAGANASQHVALDGTGDNGWKSLKKKFDLFRAKGYRIQADYVTIPTDTAVARATIRAKRSGRKVPEGNIRALHRNVSKDFKLAIDKGAFDEAVLWDNDVPLGAPPTRIFSMKDGVQTIHDEEAWLKFLAKGEEDISRRTGPGS